MDTAWNSIGLGSRHASRHGSFKGWARSPFSLVNVACRPRAAWQQPLTRAQAHGPKQLPDLRLRLLRLHEDPLFGHGETSRARGEVHDCADAHLQLRLPKALCQQRSSTSRQHSSKSRSRCSGAIFTAASLANGCRGVFAVLLHQKLGQLLSPGQIRCAQVLPGLLLSCMASSWICLAAATVALLSAPLPGP